MKSEAKKDFALRISQANVVNMILISYEIIETYIDDAKEVFEDRVALKSNIDIATRCLDEMIANLHFEYEIAKDLKQLYIYMKKRLRDAYYDKDVNALSEVRALIQGLHESYEKIKDEDKSGPLMQNTQTVTAGMTYGKNQILEEHTANMENRGYRI